MHQIHLADEVYEQARRRAAEAGFASVDEFVADMVSHEAADFDDAEPNIDHLFTPELLAIIDKAEAEVDGGHFFTSEQAKVEFARRRDEWLRKNRR